MPNGKSNGKSNGKPDVFPRYKTRPHHKVMPHGEAAHNAKLTELRIRYARMQIKLVGYRVCSLLAKKWDVNPGTLSQAVIGKTWNHLSWPPPLPPKYVTTHMSKALITMLKKAPE